MKSHSLRLFLMSLVLMQNIALGDEANEAAPAVPQKGSLKVCNVEVQLDRQESHTPEGVLKQGPIVAAKSVTAASLLLLAVRKEKGIPKATVEAGVKEIAHSVKANVAATSALIREKFILSESLREVEEDMSRYQRQLKGLNESATLIDEDIARTIQTLGESKNNAKELQGSIQTLNTEIQGIEADVGHVPVGNEVSSNQPEALTQKKTQLSQQTSKLEEITLSIKKGEGRLSELRTVNAPSVRQSITSTAHRLGETKAEQVRLETAFEKNESLIRESVEATIPENLTILYGSDDDIAKWWKEWEQAHQSLKDAQADAASMKSTLEMTSRAGSPNTQLAVDLHSKESEVKRLEEWTEELRTKIAHRKQEILKANGLLQTGEKAGMVAVKSTSKWIKAAKVCGRVFEGVAAGALVYDIYLSGKALTNHLDPGYSVGAEALVQTLSNKGVGEAK